MVAGEDVRRREVHPRLRLRNPQDDLPELLAGFEPFVRRACVGERRRHGRNQLRAFYVRRSRRLLPALVATLMLVAATFAIRGSESVTDLPRDFAAILLYVANWVLALHPKANLADGLLNPTWSLAIEEQFYILWRSR